MSDAITKGIDKIDIADYEGLPTWIVSDFKKTAFKSKYEFV